MGAAYPTGTRKMCPLPRGLPCGRCQNCYEDAWATVWNLLTDDDQQWVIDQFAYTALWAGQAPSPLALKMMAAPTSARWTYG